jgi:hypothetical protein
MAGLGEIPSDVAYMFAAEDTDHNAFACCVPHADFSRGARADAAIRIRAELVCCDIYERVHPHVDSACGPACDERFRMAMMLGGDGHLICFWGEAAARLAEES